jgi:hypothetical protein
VRWLLRPHFGRILTPNINHLPLHSLITCCGTLSVAAEIVEFMALGKVLIFPSLSGE